MRKNFLPFLLRFSPALSNFHSAPMVRTSLATALSVGLLCGGAITPHAQAQWIAYTFVPQTAYRSSYGMTTNTAGSSSNILANGWPTNWDNRNLRGVVAVYFNTNTNTLTPLVMLPPLIYTQTTSTNAGLLSTNNYTNLPVLAFTNTNANGSNSVLDPVSFYGRVKYGNATYMVGQLSTIGVDSTTNALTNILGSFNNLCRGYTTNEIGTNGVSVATNQYPSTLALKLTTLSRSTNDIPFTSSQQLVLPLTLNTALTKIMNTNTNFGTLALTSSLSPITNNPVYTNLPRLIRSNSTFTNL